MVTCRTTSSSGYTIIELMIAMGLGTMVMGAAALLSSGVQNAYSHELDDAAVQQEARFALSRIEHAVANAGSNPYDVSTAECFEAGAAFSAIAFDPDGNGVDDDIRVQADVHPQNGLIGGPTGTCNESDEDITISRDGETGSLMFWDAVDPAPVPVTTGVFTGLSFAYLTAERTPAVTADAVAFVQIALTARSPVRHRVTREFTEFTYTSEVRVRTR